MKEAKKKSPNSYNKIFPFLLLIATLFMGIGYASINSITADIIGIALANSQEGIFITDVVYKSDKDADLYTSKINSMYQTTLNSKIALSENDTSSFITYEVTLYNSTNDDYIFDDVKYILGDKTYDNNDISFEIIWHDDNRFLYSKSTISFSIKFSYADNLEIIDNNILNSYLNFSFKKIHYIEYVNIDSNGLPKYVIDGSDLTIDFSNNNYNLLIVSINGLESNNYTYKNKILTIPSVDGDVTIESRILKIKIFNKEFVVLAADPTLTTSSNNTDDENGLYVSYDTNDGSPTYYFRGDIEENYIDFAGFTWRVVRVNEDGTIRLVMQDGINVNTNYRYNTNYNNKNYMYYSNNSNAKTQLETWYANNIVDKGYSSYVVTGNYYCEQAKASYNASYATNSGTDMVVYSSYNPNFKCENDKNGKGLVNASIGLLNYDEVVYAGGYFNKSNSNYYLYNPAIKWWTMSPGGVSGYPNAVVWHVNTNGSIYFYNVGNTDRLRPVINLKADTIVTGSGTKDDHWVVQDKYREPILNNTDPVLSDNLVPIILADNGTATKADVYSEWYKYEDKRWANAVVLRDETINYNNGDTIPESNIESYFVWIPKYSYQLWDLGTYTNVTTLTNKLQTIQIRFGTTDTSDNNSGECTTPGVAGASGNCSVGEYMTHPAFQAFDSNGLWVGKFETGYDGATSIGGANQNIVNTSKIVIKPNVYSWRNITIGNMFKNSYDYLRGNESHMMKNTEWGAVAYLQHSNYGSRASVRINNNSAFITGYSSTIEPTLANSKTSIDGNRYESTSLNKDGTYTKRYNSETGYLASTTGNITGIYDMSGGSYEYVMGYTSGSSIGVGGESGLTTLYDDFFTNNNWDKYYDKYSSTSHKNYNNRILGDATGEVGPFEDQTDPDGASRYKSSFYDDLAHFVPSIQPWFRRGGYYLGGSGSGIFEFTNYTGKNTNFSFRIVLAP